MKWELNVRTTLIVPRFGMKLLGSYPIQEDDGRNAYLIQQLCWWFSMASGINAMTWLTYNMIENISDINEILKTAPESGLVLSQIGKQLICKIYHDEFRDILNEFEEFLTKATPAMLDYLHRELRWVYIVHVIFIIGCIVDPVVFSSTPILDGRLLPAHCTYPWSLNSTAVYATMYLEQVIAATTLSCMAIMDVVFSTLIWCGIVRFRYLNSQLTQAEEAMNTREYAGEQRRLIRYEYMFDSEEKSFVNKY